MIQKKQRAEAARPMIPTVTKTRKVTQIRQQRVLMTNQQNQVRATARVTLANQQKLIELRRPVVRMIVETQVSLVRVTTQRLSKQDTRSGDTEENVTKDSKDGPFPTDSEDQPPTKKPTSSPTSKPSTTTPTAAGSTDKIPTSSPSNGPTVPPTDNVFDQPTVADTPEPTYFPTDTPKCQLNALGAFGVISQDRREFEFFYQIETTPDTTEDILRNDVLPRLEREYGNRLLASLFTECGEERRLQVGGDSCEAMGFSGLPIDRALAGGKSTNVTDALARV